VGARKIVRLGRAQEAEAVGQHFDHAFADDVDFLLRQLLEDGEHEFLLAHGGGVFHLVLFGKGKQFRGGFDLEVLEFHFPHSWGSWEKIASAESNRRSQRRDRRSWVWRSKASDPMPLPVPTTGLRGTSACVRGGCVKIWEDRSRRKRPDPLPTD